MKIENELEFFKEMCEAMGFKIKVVNLEKRTKSTEKQEKNVQDVRKEEKEEV